MWGTIVGAVLGIISAGLKLLGLRKQQEIQADAEKTGAIKQQHADDQETIKQQREQLKAASNPEDAKDAADKGTF